MVDVDYDKIMETRKSGGKPSVRIQTKKKEDFVEWLQQV
jgi:hypothetical protein